MPGRHRSTRPAQQLWPGGRAGAVRLLVIVVAVVGLVAAVPRLLGRPPDAPDQVTGSPPAPATALLADGASLARSLPPAATDALPPRPGAGPCTAVRVRTSLENQDLLRLLAAAYRGDRRSVGGHCVDVLIGAEASGLTLAQVTGGLRSLPAADRFDVWAPDSGAWLRLARLAGSGSGSIVPAESVPVARTPLVVAVPARVAAQHGWVDRPPTWKQYLAAGDGHAAHGPGGFKMGRTAADQVSSGLLGLTASFSAAAGRVGGLRTADVADEQVGAQVREWELATVHYGSSEEHFMWHARSAADSGRVTNYLSAVAVTEKALYDYNRGLVSRWGKVKDRLGPPREPLRPVYPQDGTFVVDSPLAVLSAPWVSPAARAAAADLARFATTAEGQAAVRRSGYRDLFGAPDEAARTIGQYADATRVKVLPEPEVGLLEAVRDAFPAVRKRARVVFALDLSASMTTPIPGGQTRLAAAKRAVVAALRHFTDADQIGLAGFSNQPGQRRIIPGVVEPVGPLGPKRTALTAKVESLTALQATPLYAAVPDLVRRMSGPEYRSDMINGVVVLSDGRNDTGLPGTQASMLAALTAATASHPVRVFTLGYSRDRDVKVLEAISKTTGAHYYDASDPVTVEQVLGDLVTNF